MFCHPSYPWSCESSGEGRIKTQSDTVCKKVYLNNLQKVYKAPNKNVFDVLVPSFKSILWAWISRPFYHCTQTMMELNELTLLSLGFWIYYSSKWGLARIPQNFSFKKQNEKLLYKNELWMIIEKVKGLKSSMWWQLGVWSDPLS